MPRSRKLQLKLTPAQGIALLELIAIAETLPGHTLDGRDRNVLLRAGGKIAEAFARDASEASEAYRMAIALTERIDAASKRAQVRSADADTKD